MSSQTPVISVANGSGRVPMPAGGHGSLLAGPMTGSAAGRPEGPRRRRGLRVSEGRMKSCWQQTVEGERAVMRARENGLPPEELAESVPEAGRVVALDDERVAVAAVLLQPSVARTLLDPLHDSVRVAALGHA